MTTDALRRAGLVSGLGFAVVGVAAGVIAPPPPAADAAAHTVRSYITDHHAALTAAGALELIAPMVLVPFYVALRKRFADREVGTLFLAFGIITSALAVTGALVQNVLFHGAVQLDDSGLLAVFRLGRAVFDIGPAVASVGYLLAAAIGIAQSDDLPGWLAPFAAAVGIFAAIAGVVGATTTSGGPAALGLIGFLANLVWVVAASLTVLRARTTASPRPAMT